MRAGRLTFPLGAVVSGGLYTRNRKMVLGRYGAAVRWRHIVEASGRVCGRARHCEVILKRIAYRLRKATGPLQQLDQDKANRAVATGWLRFFGVSIDPQTGQTQEIDWRRMRAEASVTTSLADADSPDLVTSTPRRLSR